MKGPYIWIMNTQHEVLSTFAGAKPSIFEALQARRYEGADPPWDKEIFVWRLATTTPEFVTFMSPKMRRPGVSGSPLVVWKGQSALLKRIINVKNGPRGKGPWVPDSSADLGNFGILRPLGDPMAPRHQRIRGRQIA